MRAFAVVPTLNERAAIGELVGGLLAGVCDGVVVVDGGSVDGTDAAARSAGATVVVERARGYGRAVRAGAVAAARAGAQIYAFVDGNGTIAVDDVARVLAPVRADAADFVVGERLDGEGALRPHQRLGNRVAVEVIARTLGYRYRDVGSLRAIRADAFARLAVDELGYGFPLQLQARAAAARLRIEQVPVALRARRSRSKVSGTVRGTLGASWAFGRVLWSECLRPPGSREAGPW